MSLYLFVFDTCLSDSHLAGQNNCSDQAFINLKIKKINFLLKIISSLVSVNAGKRNKETMRKSIMNIHHHHHPE